MTSPAQKAAGEIVGTGVAVIDSTHDKQAAILSVAALVQQAITEAVDAAVATEREKYLKLAEKLRGLRELGTHKEYGGADIVVPLEPILECADELETMNFLEAG